jgi:hypothetical protein
MSSPTRACASGSLSMASTCRRSSAGASSGEQQPFDERDLAKLITHRLQLPGADHSTPLVAVTRTTTTVSSLPTLLPADILTAWQH